MPDTKTSELCKHAQAFLNEAKAPTHAPRDTITRTLEQLTELTRSLDTQSREWARLLSLSERTQPDEIFKSMYEEVYQTCRALQTQIGDAEAKLRLLSRTEEQFHLIVARMQKRAAELGYEV